MKHAFADSQTGEIAVFASRQDDLVKLAIKDNGKGLPLSFNLETNEGFGLKLVNLLTNQLNGKLQLEHGQGSAFILTFHTPL
jgi:two-component sensor histidine kinase